MREWNNAKITLDKFISITCNVLISKSKTYEMPFGLNLIVFTNAHIYNDFFRYCVKVNDKERYGKIPI